MSKLDSQSSKVQVRGAFGTTEQISLDSNRVLAHSDTLFKAANAVSIKSDAFYSDLLMWLLTTATTMRVILLAIDLGLGIMPASVLTIILLTPPLLLILYVGFQADSTHRLSCFYRFSLITAGLFLGAL